MNTLFGTYLGRVDILIEEGVILAVASVERVSEITGEIIGEVTGKIRGEVTGVITGDEEVDDRMVEVTISLTSVIGVHKSDWTHVPSKSLVVVSTILGSIRLSPSKISDSLLSLSIASFFSLASPASKAKALEALLKAILSGLERTLKSLVSLFRRRIVAVSGSTGKEGRSSSPGKNSVDVTY